MHNTNEELSPKAQYVADQLERAVKAGEAQNKECAERIIKHGAAYQLGWMDGYVKADARGRAAQMVLNVWMENDEVEALSYCTQRLANELGYIIPNNSDTAQRLYELQALKEFADWLRYLVGEEA